VLQRCHFSVVAFGVATPRRTHPSFSVRTQRIRTDVSPHSRSGYLENRSGSLVELCHHGCTDHEEPNALGRHSQSPPGHRHRGLLRRLWSRLDTIERAGYTKSDAVLVSGLFGKIKQLHNPITYFVLGILSGFRWKWCFNSPIYWFAIGFTIKWYRARYVFKTPVWDRQPNWNNIITSKEQEKDLKAFTCKKCGSTIFIAKTREFFFEGSTGIGGLGCFSCGAKGAENFVMDRDRIVEDVADVDDYFDYERPLDFVTRAERRKLLKEAQGDEDKANQILLERTTGISSESTVSTAAVTVEATSVTETTAATDVEVEPTEPVVPTPSDAPDAQPTVAVATSDDTDSDKPNGETSESEEPKPLVPSAKKATLIAEVVGPSSTPPVSKESANPIAPKPSSSSTSLPKKKGSATDKGSVDLDGLDELDMDAW
jgi:hypothetical protein